MKAYNKGWMSAGFVFILALAGSAEEVVQFGLPAEYANSVVLAIGEKGDGELVVGGVMNSTLASPENPKVGLVAVYEREGSGPLWIEPIVSNDAPIPGTVTSVLPLSNGDVLVGGSRDGAGAVTRYTSSGLAVWAQTLAAGEVSALLKSPASAGYVAVVSVAHDRDGLPTSQLGLRSIGEDGAVMDLGMPGTIEGEGLRAFLPLMQVPGYVLVSDALNNDGFPQERFLHYIDDMGELAGISAQRPLTVAPTTVYFPRTNGDAMEARFEQSNEPNTGQIRFTRITVPGESYVGYISCPIRGTSIAGAAELNPHRGAIVTYDEDAIYLEICDYERGHMMGFDIAVEHSIATPPAGNATGDVSYALSLNTVTVLADGTIAAGGSLAASILVDGESRITQTGYVVTIPKVFYQAAIADTEIPQPTLQRISRNLLDAMQASEVLWDELTYEQVQGLSNEVDAAVLQALDYDLDGHVTVFEIRLHANYEYKEGPGGIGSCTVDTYAPSGDVAFTAAVLALMVLWGLFGETRRRRGQA